MKKEIITFLALIFLFGISCQKKIAISKTDFQNPDNYILVGQLYSTQPFGFPEKIIGKVQSLKEVNYWAEEKNGKVVRRNVITTEDRKTTPMRMNFMEEYNSSGTVTKSVTLNENDEEIAYCNVEAEGKIIKKVMYYNNSILGLYTKNTYSGRNLTESKFFNANNDVFVRRIVYDYDQNGNRIKVQAFNNINTPGGYSESAYNEDGLLEHVKSYTATGTMIELWDYTYNNKGEKLTHHQENLITRVKINYTFKYEYDKMGNWIKFIYYKDNKPFILREREIKYFN